MTVAYVFGIKSVSYQINSYVGLLLSIKHIQRNEAVASLLKAEASRLNPRYFCRVLILKKLKTHNS